MSADWYSMRASDADRERAADVLKAALAEGRLDWEEHRERVDAVMRARTYGELQALIVDLPVGPTPFPLPSPGQQIGPGQPTSPAQILPPGQPPALPGRPVHALVPRPDNPPPPAPLANPWANYVPAPVRVTEPLAKVSIACAVLGLCTSGMSAVPAIVTGHLALSRIRRTNSDGVGLAVAGLVLGYLELAFVALWFVLAVLFGLGS
ncbi:DUF1707 and DUF4190 domain-containing protein [Actinopolymorpha alba]|uniref:DUF1707 and DUF4190 domain-containing protein n=1 Tax=Actinopolymorpha alba TaxID=533267 RepID=UPI00037D272B|nr:DUF1707 and DUF4190 domain-containing protein [Actinopolymorpha alba]